MGLERDVAHTDTATTASRLRLRGLVGHELARYPNFPTYGYTITRFNLDGMVAEHAEELGAALLNGVEL